MALAAGPGFWAPSCRDPLKKDRPPRPVLECGGPLRMGEGEGEQEAALALEGLCLRVCAAWAASTSSMLHVAPAHWHVCEAVGRPAFWRAFWSPQREPSVLRAPAAPTQLGTAQERVGAEAE